MINLPSIRNIIKEGTLYSRKIKTSNNLISDYIKDNINKIFADSEGKIEFNYNPDKNILDFDLKDVSKYIEIDLELLSDISNKLKSDIKNPIKLHFYYNPNIYFINENGNNSNTSYIKNLFLDIIFDKNISSNVSLYFNQGTGNFRNSNIKVIKNNKNLITYHFECPDFEYFTNITELEKYLKDSIFSNPGNIINNNQTNNNILLKFRLNEYDKRYNDFIESLEYIYKEYNNEREKSKILKKYQNYFLNNISSGKYNIEIINKVDKNNHDYDTLFYYNKENLEILLKSK